MTREDYKLLPLASVGLARGVFNVYVRPELTSKRMWAAIGLGVLAYELSAPSDSNSLGGADRSLVKYPIITRAAIGITALHLANLLPDRFDPFSALARLK